MLDLADEAIDAIERGDFMLAAALKLAFGGGHRFWTGDGPREFPFEAGETYKGVGDRSFIRPVGAALGDSAGGLEIDVSNIHPDIAPAIHGQPYRGKPAILHWLIFDASGINYLGELDVFRGRLDQAPVSETIGGPSVITLQLEGPLRDLSRANGRTRSDQDQRQIGGPDDGGMKHVAIAGVTTLYWGQKPEKAEQVVNGGNNGAALAGYRIGGL